MRIHPRTRIVERAEIQIGDAVRQAIKEHELTFAEIQQILATTQLRWLKYALRHERHPANTQKGGDEE